MPTQTDDPYESEASIRLREMALSLWGCRRPDKVHHLTQETAETHLALEQRRLGHSEDAHTFRCCDVGWVWGRRPPPCICTSGTPDPACEHHHGR